MKKTLITLMALSSVAMADAGYDYYWVGQLQTSDTSKEQTVEDYSAVFDIQSPITLTFTSWELNNSAADNQHNGSYAANVGNNVTSIRPNANIGNGASYTLNFTITNTSETTITLNSVGFNTFVYNSGGSLQEGSDNVKRDVVYTLNGAAEGTVEYRFYNNGNTNEVHFNFATPIELTAKTGANFSLTISEGTENSGTFVGLSKVQVYIPEPATATLSLLALCGLAARRRRK